MPRYNFVRSDKKISLEETKELMLDQGEDIRCIIALLYLTGARVSEVLALKVGSFDFSGHEVKIMVNTLKRKKLSFSLKCNICGNRQRVPRKYLRRRENLKCAICSMQDYTVIAPNKKDSYYIHSRPLFFNHDAPFIPEIRKYVDEYTKVFGRDDKLFGLSRQLVGYYIWKRSKIVSPHCFRHSRLQKLADAGLSARAIQKFAGHVSISSSDPYIEASEAMLKPTKDFID